MQFEEMYYIYVFFKKLQMQLKTYKLENILSLFFFLFLAKSDRLSKSIKLAADQKIRDAKETSEWE